MLAFIHGFNSSAASRTFGLLREVFPLAAALEYPSGGYFADNLALLQDQIATITGAGSKDPGAALVLAGSSLGGFYAAQLSTMLHCPCALINPVIRPHDALRPFVGRQRHFHTGEEWEFTAAACESYAVFSDPRTTALPRLLVLGLSDELLDPLQSLAYWQGHAHIHTTQDGHSLAAPDAVLLDWLRQQEETQTRAEDETPFL